MSGLFPMRFYRYYYALKGHQLLYMALLKCYITTYFVFLFDDNECDVYQVNYPITSGESCLAICIKMYLPKKSKLS